MDIYFISVIIHAPKGSCAETWAVENDCIFVPYGTLISNDNISAGYGEGDNSADGISLVTRHFTAFDPEYKEVDLSGKTFDPTVDPETVKFEAYDIALVDGNLQPVQPLGKVKVSIPCPPGYTGANCKVYRVNANGSFTDREAFYSNEYLIFTTDYFSTYLITETELETGSNVIFGDANGDGSVNSLDAVKKIFCRI